MSGSDPRAVEEVRAPGEVPLWQHPEWQQQFPWLVQGVTGRGDPERPFDLGLYGAQPVGEVLFRWQQLRDATGIRRAVHSRQVHGAELRAHGPGDEPGLLVGSGYDGHLTRAAGVLLTVSVADCVPVYLVDAASRAVALVHAGWRGVAGGIVERALERLRQWATGGNDEIWIHCGPAICGECYEVGPEVHAAILPDDSPPASATPIDLRAAIARRVVSSGVAPERVTVSGHCTRCGAEDFFSHRGGSPQRQMAVLALRP